MKKSLLSLLPLGGLIALLSSPAMPLSAETINVASPDGKLVVTVDDADGRLTYSVKYADREVLTKSPLGLETNVGNFSTGLLITGSKTETVKDSYTLNRCKTSQVDYEADKLTIDIENQRRGRMAVVFMVSDNDVAFRYELPRQNRGETGSVRIMNENTGFCFTAQTTTFMCPQSDAMIGWKRSKPSYEEVYKYDAPLTEPSQYGKGYTFPCLFKVQGVQEVKGSRVQEFKGSRVQDTYWVLGSETGTSSSYCGCRLSDYRDGGYKIEFPMPEENNGNGTVEPAFALPGATPWRTITVGETLKPIVETTAAWNTVKPLYEPSIDYKYGKSTWSWIVWQDASMNWDDQITFIDLAATLGYPYILIDAGWDQAIGYERMETMVKYAQGKGVDVFLWYSSSGYWNDIVQSPINVMDNPIARKRDMQWMHRIGVKGIKVDFWGGDKQETMRLYEQVLSDANDNGLMVIFHGCTIPRGWERMYPNFVGCEAVLASENVVFGQYHADKEAKDTATHPFIRNTLGCMEWGGSFLNRHIRKDNQGGTERKTTDCHEMAQAVLFQNPIQNFAITPENLRPEAEGGAPEVSVEFMKQVPTTWNETRFIDGYPGRFCILARRHGDTWYVAGNNAEENAKKVEIDLSGIVEKGDVVTLYSDQKDGEPQKTTLKINKPEKVTVNINHNGGFIIVR